MRIHFAFSFQNKILNSKGSGNFYMIPPYKLFASMKKPKVCLAEGSCVGKYLLLASKFRFASTEEIPPRIKFSTISKCSRCQKFNFGLADFEKGFSRQVRSSVKMCTVQPVSSIANFSKLLKDRGQNKNICQ